MKDMPLLIGVGWVKGYLYSLSQTPMAYNPLTPLHPGLPEPLFLAGAGAVFLVRLRVRLQIRLLLLLLLLLDSKICYLNFDCI